MGQESQAAAGGVEDSRLAWRFTIAAVVPCLAFILALSLEKDALARPLAEGSLVTVGLVAGLGLAAYLVAAALVYTYVMNRREA